MLPYLTDKTPNDEWYLPCGRSQAPTMVPTEDPVLLCIPYGLLINELQRSSRGVIRSMMELLKLALNYSLRQWFINQNEQTLIKQVADNAIETQRVSLFTALSDPEDSFDSQRAIMETGRDDFIFNRSSIPTTRGWSLRKNSFAYDYYCHDDFNVLLRNNDMTDKVCWDSLKSVQLLLKNLVTALKSISGLDQKIAAEEARNRRIANQNEQDFYIKVSDRRGVYKGRRLLCDAWTGEVIRPLGRGEKASEVLSVEEDESMLDAVVQSFQFLAKDFKHKFKQAGKAKA